MGESNSNPNGDHQDDSAEITALFESLDSETQESVLTLVNQGSKKDFKDFPSLVKSLREADKTSAQYGQVKKQLEDLTKSTNTEQLPVKTAGEGGQPNGQGQSVISPVMKSIYFKTNPEVEHVWDDVLKAAEETGRDPFEVYEGSSFFKAEAKARAEAKAKEQSAMGRVTTPGSRPGSGDLSFSEIDLDNPEHVKWLKAKEGRLDSYNDYLKSTNFGGFR